MIGMIVRHPDGSVSRRSAGMGRAQLRTMSDDQLRAWQDRFVRRHLDYREDPLGGTIVSLDATPRQRARFDRSFSILANRVPISSPGFMPGNGNMGGMGNASASFMSGLAGMGAASAAYTIATDASIDPRFSRGEPGIYVVRMVVKDVRLNQPTTALHDTKPYNDALQAQGLNATVTAVRFVGDRNTRDANWAGTLLDSVFGSGSNTDNLVTDMHFDVTVRIESQPTRDRSAANPNSSVPSGAISDPNEPMPMMNGMGAVQIGAGAVFAVVGIIAVVLAVMMPGFGKMVVDGVKFVGTVAGAAIGGAAGAVAENAVPILLAVGVGALALFMLRKSGAKYSRGSGFSF